MGNARKEEKDEGEEKKCESRREDERHRRDREGEALEEKKDRDG